MASNVVRYFAQTKKDITSLEEVHLCVTEENSVRLELDSNMAGDNLLES